MTEELRNNLNKAKAEVVGIAETLEKVAKVKNNKVYEEMAHSLRGVAENATNPGVLKMDDTAAAESSEG